MKLHDYQEDVGIRVTNALKNNKSYLMALDRGLGKTFISLSLVHILKADREKIKVLIVAKAVNLKDPWVNELSKEYNGVKFSFIKLHGRRLSDYKYDSETRNREVFDYKKCDIILTSYDTLLLNKKLFDFQDFDFIVFDEIHNYTGGKKDSKIFSFLVNEIPSIPKVLLTGSPVQNNKSELKRMGKLLGLNVYSEDSIEAIKKVLMHQAAFLSKTTTSEIKLPNKYEFDIHLPLGNEIPRQIEKVSKQKSSITHIQMMPILSMPKNIDLRLIEGRNSKVKFLIDLLTNLPKTDKVIVFSCFVETLQSIANALYLIGIDYVLYSGVMSFKERESTIKLFNQKDDLRIILISLKAGSEGLNLQRANHVVIFDPWWNPQKTNQAVDRAFRQGQKSTVFVYNLLFDEDNVVIKKAIGKEKMHDQLFGLNVTIRKKICFQTLTDIDGSKIQKFVSDEILPLRKHLDETQKDTTIQPKSSEKEGIPTSLDVFTFYKFMNSFMHIQEQSAIQENEHLHSVDLNSKL